MKEFLKINIKDNVVVALKDIAKDTAIEVDGKTVLLKEDVKRGHKIALTDIKTDENIEKD